MNDIAPSVCAILLAGGKGTRMLSEIPKQFLFLGDKPLALHSFDLFIAIPEISEIVVVCEPHYRELFSVAKSQKPIHFAVPGDRRQDSTFNGMKAISKKCDFLCIHDAVRPFINRQIIKRILDAAQHHGAAVAGMPVKFTIKESDTDHFVHKTPDRAMIWEVQTPQIVRYEWMVDGFKYVEANNLAVTDDASLIELLGKKVKLVKGDYMNIKVTDPLDFSFANYLHRTLSNPATDVT